MAYGKIKADTFVYDNSGSDVEVTLASLGNKVDAANPTFTGTVTIPTPSSGDNTTKAASTAFVVAGFAPKASPTFTGTVNAAALTLSGNLTVNGTTTTVSSTTIEVADKNLELGKVSTPTDTTADGGGITLKGATDKTFNWVDATDAWTSNQHIHLGDTPKLLLGTDQDAEINHNGSNLFIQNTTGNININPKANETSILCVPDGQVELYNDNIKVFETVGNGVKVLGTEGAHAYVYISADEGDDNADQWRLQAASDGVFTIGNYSTGSWVNSITISGSGNITGVGTVSDSKGDVRSIPKNAKSSAYTLVASDAGKIIVTNSNVTLNTTMGEGDVITILNESTSDITITQGSGVTIYNSADGSTGNRTLAARGMATMYSPYSNGSNAYISGTGLS